MPNPITRLSQQFTGTLSFPVQIAISLLIIMLPTVIMFLLINTTEGIQVKNYIPLSDDYSMNWHQIGTFKVAGFEGGYYSHNERIPRFTFTHFYFWGPAHVVIYGTLASIFGYEPYYILYFNLLVISLGLGTYMAMLRLTNLRQYFALALAIATTWIMFVGILHYLQQSLHIAYAIVAAALFARLLDKGANVSLAFKVIAFLLIVGFTYTRIIWGILYFPYFLLAFRLHNYRIVMGVLTAAMVCFAITVLLWNFSSAPFPMPAYTTVAAIYDVLSLESDSQQLADSTLPKVVLGQMESNLNLYVPSSLSFSLNAYLLPGYQYMVVLISIVTIAILKYYKRPTGLAQYSWQELGLYSFVVLSTFIFYFVIYPAFPRHLTPFMILVLWLAIARKHWIIVGVMVGINLLAIGTFPTYFRQNAWDLFNYQHPPEQIAFGEAIAPYVIYEPQDNAWCNTLLMPEFISRTFSLVPFGIGYSRLFADFNQTQQEIYFPLQSRYIVLTAQQYKDYAGKLNVEPLTDTPYGRLYLNLDTSC